MIVSLGIVTAGTAGLLAGAGLGWTLRGMRRQRVPQRAELERLRTELRSAVGLLADREARIATLEADREADQVSDRCDAVRFETERCSPRLAQRQFG